MLVAGLSEPLALGLTGTLGAGKTALVQAIARAAAIDAGEVTSPTFTLLQSYRGRSPRGELTIHHLDAYRIADEDEFIQLGVDELFAEPDSWTIVEWADRVAGVMPAETIWIELTIGERADRRQLEFRCPPVWTETITEVTRGWAP